MDWRDLDAPTTPKDETATQRLQATLEMAQRCLSEVAAENTKLKQKIKMLAEQGPPWAKNQLASLRSDNAQLRRDVVELTELTELPPEAHKRYRASCRRWRLKKQAELNRQWRILHEENERTVRQRTGVIDDKFWDDLMLCLHPEASPSKDRKRLALDGLRQHERALRRR